jgi:OFA family oxalate/formate antiporter-like MFS transporter
VDEEKIEETAAEVTQAPVAAAAEAVAEAPKDEAFAGKVINRWWIVVAGVVVQLCLGVLYAWSVVRPVLEKAEDDGGFGWTKAESGYPYQASLLFFAIGMVVAGRIQDKIGPRKVAIMGGVMLALGAALTGVVGDTRIGVILTYGVLGGLGVGFAYVTPVATLVKWFPDKRGFITGLAVFGFGLATVVFAPVITALLDGVGIATTFYILAAIFLVLVCGFGAVLRVPPAGWKPAGWNPPETMAKTVDSPFGKTARTWQFWVLWAIYFFGAGVGLMTIGKAKTLGIDVAHISRDSALLTTGVMVLGIFNALGRLGWGTVSDKLGRLRTMIVMFALYIAVFLGLMRWTGSAATWLIGLCVIGFCFGGYLAIMPSLTADYYGTKSYGANYGALFTAYGIGGVVWPYIGDALATTTSDGGTSYSLVWYIAAAFCVLGLLLTAVVRAPKRQEDTEIQ